MSKSVEDFFQRNYNFWEDQHLERIKKIQKRMKGFGAKPAPLKTIANWYIKKLL